MATSKLFGAEIDVTDIENFFDKQAFFTNWKLDLHSMRSEIDTSTTQYKEFFRGLGDYFAKTYVYHYKRKPWQSRSSFILGCSITIKQYHASPAAYCQTVTGLLPVKKMQSIAYDDKIADFTLVVRNKQFKIQKCILGAVSKVFMTMFTCGLDETKNGSAKIDCDPEIFEYFINYIYNSTWPEEKMPTICLELYELANRYDVKVLMALCHAFIMEKNIDSNNALALYEFACTCKAEELLDASWEHIKM